MRYILFLLFALLIPSVAGAAPAVSRSSGTAPLYVHFWADVAESTTGNMPFHDLDYSWSFGDTSPGTWLFSGGSKNVAKGAAAGHVYETPGTYTATLTVRDANGVVGTPTNFTITVSDPEVVFASCSIPQHTTSGACTGADGTWAVKTTCISTGTDFTGCPSGATQETTTNLSTVTGYATAGSRVLFRRGDSWTTSATLGWPNNSGPVHIGAFGTCTSPGELEICSNAPTINVNGDSIFLYAERKGDWRVTDLKLVGQKTGNSSAVAGSLAIKNQLFMRLDISNFNSGVVNGLYRENDDDFLDGVAYVSNKIVGTYNNVFYAVGERVAIMGNRLENSDIQHILRSPSLYQGVISHNIVSGASLTNTLGTQALKLHGPVPGNVSGQGSRVGTFAETGASGVRNFTRFNIISNNIFGGSGPWPVSIGPENAETTQNLFDIIFEKNKVISQYGSVAGNDLDPNYMVRLAGRFISARNNILDGTSREETIYGISFIRNGIEHLPLGSRAYNNTCYSNSNVLGGWSRCIVIASSVTDAIVRNNYFSAPRALSTPLVVNDFSGAATMSNNVHTSTPLFVDPNNADPLLRDFRLQANAPAIAQGMTLTTMLDDFDSEYRDQGGAYDLGAFMYGDPVCGPTRRDLCTVANCATDGDGWWDTVNEECLIAEPGTPVNGACGLNDEATLSSLASGHSDNCSVGNVSGFASVTGGWEWDCLGVDGGTTASCTATQYTAPPGGGTGRAPYSATARVPYSATKFARYYEAPP